MVCGNWGDFNAFSILWLHVPLSVIILIILEASIYDEGGLSEGFMCGRSLCPGGIIYGGFFSRIRVWRLRFVHDYSISLPATCR